MTTKNIFKVVTSLVQWVLIIALIVVAIGSFGTRIPALARLGFNFFAVTSGSMEPTIPTGSLLSVGKYKLDDLKEGDIITYRVRNEQSNEQAIVTHRIARVEKKEEQKLVDDKGNTESYVSYNYKTKGDANSDEDQYMVGSGDVIGLYKWHVPSLGYVTAFAQTPAGFIALVIVPAAIVILWEIASLILYFKRHFEQKAATEVEQLKAELAEAKAAKSTKSKKTKKND